MKKISTLLLGIIALGATTVKAQTDAPSTIQRVSVMYDLNTLSPKYGDNSYFNGVGAGYTVDFRVSKTLPLYVGTGLNLRVVFDKDKIVFNKEYDFVNIDVKSTLVNLNLPVNVSYRVPVADNFYLTPQLGLDFRVQVFGQSKLDLDSDFPELNRLVSNDSKLNLFSKDDLGDAHLRRFQMGWHAALNFEYNRFNLGLSYGTDFVKIHKNIGGSNFLVSLGYTVCYPPIHIPRSGLKEA